MPAIALASAEARPEPAAEPSDFSGSEPDMTQAVDPSKDPLAELELRLAAFEQVLAETREEMKAGTWRTVSLTERMRNRATEILSGEPDSLLGSGLMAFAEEMERKR